MAKKIILGVDLYKKNSRSKNDGVMAQIADFEIPVFKIILVQK